ncbi:MAG: hypothetical protein HC872_08120 [Gammaproteobacteria bacterium]|nr:hypothetical protein [Gammaproteobacteria bacterium]
MSGADLEDSDLRERARSLLVAGKLPQGEPSSTWAGSVAAKLAACAAFWCGGTKSASTWPSAAR